MLYSMQVKDSTVPLGEKSGYIQSDLTPAELLDSLRKSIGQFYGTELLDYLMEEGLDEDTFLYSENSCAKNAVYIIVDNRCVNKIVHQVFVEKVVAVDTELVASTDAFVRSF